MKKYLIFKFNFIFFFVLAEILVTTSLVYATSTAEGKDLEMQELLKLDLEELSVNVASKRDESISTAPGVITVITAEEIEKFGGNNLGEILSRLPNTFRLTTGFLRDNLTSLRGLQGTLDNRILILINGRPYRDGFSGGHNMAFYRSMPLEIIERVEVIRGPSSVLYGTNALSGVINVVTKSPKEFHPNKLTGGYGADDTVQASGLASHSDGEFNFIVSGKYLDSDGWGVSLIDANGDLFLGDLSEKNYGLIGIAEFKNFTFSGFTGFKKDTTIQTNPAPSSRELEALRRDFFDLQYHYTHSNSWQSKINVTYNGFDFTDNVGIDSNFTDTLMEVSSGGELSKNLNLVSGFIYQKLIGDLADGQTSYTNDRFNGYMQTDYEPWVFLKLVAGFNVSKPQSIDFNVIPRFGTILHHNNEFGVKLLYGKAFSSPFAGSQQINRPTVKGNPNLNPEESKTFNAQVFFNAPKIYTAVSYYKSVITDAIQLTPGAGFFTFNNNRGEFDFDGLEWEWKAYPLAGLLFTGSISYQTNEDQTGSPDIGFIPNFMAKAGLSYESTSGFSFGIFNSYFGEAAKLPNASRVNPSADSYNWLTLNSSLDLPKYFPRWDFPNITLNLFVDNVLDEDTYFPEFAFQRINTIPARRGIGVFGGATFKF